MTITYKSGFDIKKIGSEKDADLEGSSRSNRPKGSV